MQDQLDTRPFILLVEDNSVALHMLETILHRAGCHYITAINGEMALGLAKTTNFDLIITDIGLPGISGSELTQHIRNWETINNKKPIPIIGLTAQSQEETQKIGLRSGMSDVFIKPIDITTISAIIAKYYKVSNALTKNSIANKKYTLGLDLPNEEHQLFELQRIPLLDIKTAIKKIGDEVLLFELLQLMLDSAIPNDEAALIKAYNSKNWDLVEKLAHKIKGGAVYCGTTRLQFACQYLERYRKAGHSDALDALYQQLTNVISETKQQIQYWLNS
jgi:CheY-like chemotaxis protein